MYLWIYILICIAISVWSAIEINTTHGVVAIIASAILYSIGGYFLGYKVGVLATQDLIQKRVSEVQQIAKPAFAKRFKGSLKNKRLGSR